MTTLTRNRKDEKFGDHTKTTLWVSGDKGAVAATLISGPFLGPSRAGTSVSVCSPKGDPDELLSDNCPLWDGPCYGDTFGPRIRGRAIEAYESGGEDAVYAVLADLYRQEFES